MTAEQLAALRLRLLMPDPWLAALRFPGLHADMLCWHDLRTVAAAARRDLAEAVKSGVMPDGLLAAAGLLERTGLL